MEEPKPEAPAPEAESTPEPESKPAEAPKEETETVSVSLFSWPGYGFWFVAKEKGLTDGFDLDIKIIEDPYESFGLMSAGQLDVTSSTVEYGPIAAEEGVPVKLVSYTNASYGTDKILLGPGIEGGADLKGKSVAVLEGGLTQIYMGIFLEQNGVKFDEVSYVNVIMDDAVAAMVSGKVQGGEFWEPFGQQVLETLEGAKVASTSKDAYYQETGLLADGMYMSGSFLDGKPELAAKVMKAYFDAVAYWKANTAEANEIIAKAIQFDVKDVEAVIGADGGPKDGGLYVFGWPESSAFMGVTGGEPPVGKNGQIKDHWKLTNDWWVKFGVCKENHPPEAGIAFGPMKSLAESGYGK
ncbi:MAG: ABC transporter substrate-binding protein [Verrucomicrobiae bacterium]|nr:ABC transporter substrate-binding protein [Verrucomicrobiae bacterium]